MSTPDPRPSTLDPGPSTLSTTDPEPICELDLREDVGEKEQRDEKQPGDEDVEPKDHPMIGEQPDGKQTEEKSDNSLVNVNQYGYPNQGHFERATYSYCSGTSAGLKPSCCSLCKIHAFNSRLKYVCVMHEDARWHERNPGCTKVYIDWKKLNG